MRDNAELIVEYKDDKITGIDLVGEVVDKDYSNLTSKELVDLNIKIVAIVDGRRMDTVPNFIVEALYTIKEKPNEVFVKHKLIEDSNLTVTYNGVIKISQYDDWKALMFTTDGDSAPLERIEISKSKRYVVEFDERWTSQYEIEYDGDPDDITLIECEEEGEEVYEKEFQEWTVNYINEVK